MVSTVSKRSRAHARHVVESWPPENSTRAERDLLVSGISGFMACNPLPRYSVGTFERVRIWKGGRMFFSDILSQKGGLVFTVTPGTTLSQISQQLSTRRIGSVLVMADTDRV